MAVGEFESEEEAWAVCARLDLMNDNDMFDDIPEELDLLLNRL